MALESLYQLIAELNSRIQRHSTALQENEALTRYVLIDPFLRGLGWDTENPEQVHPEYRAGSGSADYALLKDGQPIMIVEAKRLNTRLQDGIEQAINYCIQQGTPYFAVTYGARWQIYDIYKQVPLADKVVAEFDLADQMPSDTVIRSLAMWRPHVGVGAPGSIQWPLLGPSSTVRSTAETGTHPTKPPGSPQTSVDSTEWHRLSRLQHRPHDKAPKTLRFPDGTQVSIGKWVTLTLEVVRWLSANGTLAADRCPIQRAGRYLVNLNPIHPSGRAYHNDKRIGTFHVEANYSGRDQLRNTLIILSHLEQDANEFLVTV